VKQTANHLLTVVDTDELIRRAATEQMGAIEDATVTNTDVTYFFEIGIAGRVDRRTGAVTFKVDLVYE
jgi:hypothetical protein